jgi:stress response protein SCP2
LQGIFSDKSKFLITGTLSILNCHWSLIGSNDVENSNHFDIDGGLFRCNKMIMNGNNKNINFYSHISNREGKLMNKLSNAEYENIVLIYL